MLLQESAQPTRKARIKGPRVGLRRSRQRRWASRYSSIQRERGIYVSPVSSDREAHEEARERPNDAVKRPCCRMHFRACVVTDGFDPKRPYPVCALHSGGIERGGQVLRTKGVSVSPVAVVTASISASPTAQTKLGRRKPSRPCGQRGAGARCDDWTSRSCRLLRT